MTNLKLPKKNTRHSTILWREVSIFCHPERRLIIRGSQQGLRSHYQQIDDSVQENKQQRCQINRISNEVPREAAAKSGNGDISTSQHRSGRPLMFQLGPQPFLNNIQPVDPINPYSGRAHLKERLCSILLRPKRPCSVGVWSYYWIRRQPCWLHKDKSVKFGGICHW